MGYYVEVEKGVRLFVQDLNPEGQTTIVFIHGWPLSHKQFEYQFTILPQYGVRCIGLDWRGFGQSDKPFFGYNFDRLADDLRVVIDAIGIQNFILLGHSTGGAIAARYMSRHKGYGVAGLVLVDAAVPVGIPPEVANPIIDQSLNDRPNMLNDLTNMFFFQYATRPFQQWFFDLGLEASGWSTAAIMKLLSETDLKADLPAIQVSTLIIHGLHDQVIPFSQAEALHKQLPNSQLVPLLYSGHGGFWEERERFNHILMEWLGLAHSSS